MSGHLCPDCQVCPACGASAWCEGDRILVVPCEHHGYCGECNVEHCIDCRLEAERDMYDTGEYDPRSDPFYRPEAKAADDAYWTSGPREVPGSPGIFRYPKDAS